jgi:hypothetical protein
MQPITEDFFCALLAQSCGEPIAGTATESIGVWLALEVPQVWGAKALPDSNLPPAVKERLAAWEKLTPGVRLQFIKQGVSFCGEGILFFVALGDEADPVLYRFQLSDYRDLLEFDLASVMARDPRYDAQRHEDSLFLVCTNGKRDRCCAKWGLPLYQTMAAMAPAQVWQTTHTGGHRFAATLVSLPQGIGYGWLEPVDAAPLINAHARGHLYRLDRLRGRSCYDRIVQAAECFLRQQSGQTAFGAYRLQRATQIDETHWGVEFQTSDGNEVHRLELEAVPDAFANPHSCGKPADETVAALRLTSYFNAS